MTWQKNVRSLDKVSELTECYDIYFLSKNYSRTKALLTDLFVPGFLLKKCEEMEWELEYYSHSPYQQLHRDPASLRN